jgi:hypothetical protein
MPEDALPRVTEETLALAKLKDGARFPPDWLVGAGAGINNRGSGRGRRVSPAPPCPVPLPSLGGIGGRDCETQRERIRFDRGWGKVRVWEAEPAYKNRVGPPVVPRWQPAHGLSYRAGPCSDRDKNRAFGRAFGLRAFWTSIGLLGLAWVTDGWRSMLCGWWDEEVRLWEDRVDRLGQKSCVCTLHFLIIRLLIPIMQFVLCILLFDFVISVMYLYGVLVDCLVYAWLCVWLTGCVIVLLLGSTRFYGLVFPICFFVIWLCSACSRSN